MAALFLAAILLPQQNKLRMGAMPYSAAERKTVLTDPIVSSPVENPEAADASPRIVRTARLTIVTGNFGNVRPEMDLILKTHGGYMGQLVFSQAAGRVRSLSATLQIPANQLDDALTEIRRLGRVEEETISGEEVTQQSVDLAARLANARATEQRLVELMRQRTASVSSKNASRTRAPW